ncbi:unnamed protein product [Staurois parvus]|uniref:Uncharacterized protein n=1 Tax=Staurois parvus TaxID=386267 RepID=A0ABN9E1G7_9NEOB|nr:unnamed protein product [Staurois parvus]
MLVHHWTLNGYTRMMPAGLLLQAAGYDAPPPPLPSTALTGSPMPSGEPGNAAGVSAS